MQGGCEGDANGMGRMQAGADMEEVRRLIEGFSGRRVSAGEPIYSSDAGSERIEVYLRDSSM
jgi:hypothetical protein